MKVLEDILATPYSFVAVADQEDGGWFVYYPDLPGCMTQAETFEEVASMAQDAFRLYVTTLYEDGTPIPEPTFHAEPVWNWESVRPRHDALVFTARQAAAQLEISVSRVHKLAVARNVGTMVNNARMFSQDDIDAMRVRVPGRPWPKAQESTDVLAGTPGE